MRKEVGLTDLFFESLQGKTFTSKRLLSQFHTFAYNGSDVSATISDRIIWNAAFLPANAHNSNNRYDLFDFGNRIQRTLSFPNFS